MYNTEFKGKEFNPLPEDVGTITPLQYLKQFWEDKVCEHLAHHTNLYSAQESGKLIGTTKEEIEVFLVFNSQWEL